MCNLCRLKVARKPLALKAPLDHGWLCINKIIDSFHLRNHINPECHTSFSPQKLKEIHPDANTQAGEQTFVWMARFKNIVCAMNKAHHLHCMVRKRNSYTAKCYANGKKPVLPQVKSTLNFIVVIVMQVPIGIVTITFMHGFLFCFLNSTPVLNTSVFAEVLYKSY